MYTLLGKSIFISNLFIFITFLLNTDYIVCGIPSLCINKAQEIFDYSGCYEI